MCSREQEAMNGIPHLQCILYIKALRPYMDIQTGIVGKARGISWQSIREALYVEPGAGLVDSGSPSKQQVRTAANGLIKAGLITSMSVGKQLIFKCVLAETDITKQNKVNTKSTRQVNTLEPNREAKSNQKVNTYKSGEVNTPPGIRDIKSSTSSENSISQDEDDKILIFPNKLNDKEILAIRNLLKSFDRNTAQAMLDELAGHMAVKQITSPIGYFRTIVKDAKAGIFHPERGLRVAIARKNQLAIQKQISESSTSVTKNSKLPCAKKQKHLKPNLRDFLKNSAKQEFAS